MCQARIIPSIYDGSLTLQCHSRMMQDAMHGMGVSWSRLPEEICERVLSYLTVPALCKCRVVCKAWNELASKLSFLDLCDLNGSNIAYLFVPRDSFGCDLRRGHNAYRRTMYSTSSIWMRDGGIQPRLMSLFWPPLMPAMFLDS